MAHRGDWAVPIVAGESVTWGGRHAHIWNLTPVPENVSMYGTRSWFLCNIIVSAMRRIWPTFTGAFPSTPPAFDAEWGREDWEDITSSVSTYLREQQFTLNHMLSSMDARLHWSSHFQEQAINGAAAVEARSRSPRMIQGRVLSMAEALEAWCTHLIAHPHAPAVANVITCITNDGGADDNLSQGSFDDEPHEDFFAEDELPAQDGTTTHDDALERDECAICCAPLCDDRASLIGCTHHFHEQCIVRWAMQRQPLVCPTCRHSPESVRRPDGSVIAVPGMGGDTADGGEHEVENERCCICQDELHDSTSRLAEAVPCGHTFHDTCIREWCAQTPHPHTPVCPLCRSDMEEFVRDAPNDGNHSPRSLTPLNSSDGDDEDNDAPDAPHDRAQRGRRLPNGELQPIMYDDLGRPLLPRAGRASGYSTEALDAVRRAFVERHAQRPFDGSRAALIRAYYATRQRLARNQPSNAGRTAQNIMQARNAPTAHNIGLLGARSCVYCRALLYEAEAVRVPHTDTHCGDLCCSHGQVHVPPVVRCQELDTLFDDPETRTALLAHPRQYVTVTLDIYDCMLCLLAPYTRTSG
jgi:hypothetical protein